MDVDLDSGVDDIKLYARSERDVNLQSYLTEIYSKNREGDPDWRCGVMVGCVDQELE